MTIRGVCFDATGTLFELAESVGTVYSRAAAEVGVRLPAWRLDDAFARVMRHGPGLAETSRAFATQAEREEAERSWWRNRVRQTFQATDSTVEFPDPQAFADDLFDRFGLGLAWRERSGIRALLRELAARGFRLGVVSNFDHRLPKILENLDLMRFFSVIEIPSRHARAKPEPAVFEALAGAFGCRVEELAYVGDDPPEVLAAIAALGVRVFDVGGNDAHAGVAGRGSPSDVSGLVDLVGLAGLAGLADSAGLAGLADLPELAGRVDPSDASARASAAPDAAKLAQPDDSPEQADRPAK